MKTKNIFLFIALLACPIFAQAQAYIEKKVTYDPNTPGQYTANLEAFMTKTSFTTPVDIVLVVDVSKYQGSKLVDNELKGAIPSFITNLQTNFSGRTDVKLAIVAYSQTVTVTSDGLKPITEYKLLNKTYAEVTSIPAQSGGYHYPEVGLKKSEDLFDKNDNHQKIVVLCIYNLPNQTNKTAADNTSTSSAYNIENILNPFSNGLKEAWTLKNEFDATIFSLIIATKSTAENIIHTGSYGSNMKKMTLNYFERFSSKYKNTYSCNVESSTNYSALYKPKFYQRNESTEDPESTVNEYVYYGNTTALLKTSFSSIVTKINDICAPTTLDPSKLSVADVIGDQMKYAGVDNTQISLYKSKCTKLEGGDYYFDDVNKETVSATKNISNNTVTVSGYDFVANKVSGTASSGSGYKLIVQYPMIIKSGVTMPGTLYTGASGSGIINDGTIMKALTPASVNVYKIQVTISGLHNGESATFNVYKLDGSNKTLKTRLIATQKDDTGSASTSYIVPEAGNYEIEETSWNWPYTLTTPTSGRSITKSVSGTSVVNFEFSNGSSATSPNHTESSTVITTLN